MSKTIMARVLSDAVLDQAYEIICKQRINHHHNSDIWHIRFHWHKIHWHKIHWHKIHWHKIHWHKIKPTIKTQLGSVKDVLSLR